MLINKGQVLLPGLLLVMLLITLSGCGSAPISSALPSGKPDSVRIEIDQVTGQKPVVNLSIASMVQQLYTTISTLPQLPGNQACTAELGPHYTLTFSQAGKTLVTVVAKRDGCRPVSIPGETQDRQATPLFWTELDQAIKTGIPAASLERLAISRSQ